MALPQRAVALSAATAVVVASVACVYILMHLQRQKAKEKRTKESSPLSPPSSPSRLTGQAAHSIPQLPLTQPTLAAAQPEAASHSHILLQEPKDWENPQCLGRSRERPRPTLGVFSSEDAARRHVEYPEASDNVLSLNGPWRFALFPSPAAALDAPFPDPDTPLDPAVWTTMPVPSCWQLQDQTPPRSVSKPGSKVPKPLSTSVAAAPATAAAATAAAGTAGALAADWSRRWDPPIYCNFQYPIPVTPPTVPALNPTGCYRRRVRLPPRWRRERRRVLAHFAGVDSAFYLWCNGRLVGFSKDSRLPAEFDLTDVLEDGDYCGDDGGDGDQEKGAVLAVLAVRWSDGTYLEDQDHWRLSGIHREVRLIALPQDGAISDFSWKARLPDDPAADAELEVSVLLDSRPFVPEDSVRVTAVLYDEGVMRCPEIDLAVDAPRPADGYGGYVAAAAGNAEAAVAALNAAMEAAVGVGSIGKTGGDGSPAVMVAAAGTDLMPADGRGKAAAALAEAERVEHAAVSEAEAAAKAAAAGRPAAARASCRIVIGSRGDAAAVLTLRVPAPRLWCPDRPHLYTLVVGAAPLAAVAAAAGKNSGEGAADSSGGEVFSAAAPWQFEACRVGFRKVEIVDGELRLNGRRVTVAGVNRHEHCELGGKTVSRAGMLLDALLLRRFNFNAVRCSHYPNHPFWYELCDRLGLMVVDEANIETHGMKPFPGYLSGHPDWGEAYMDRVQRMWERDKCHPSIIAWSLGNESGYGLHHDDAAAWLRSIDATRVVMYEPAGYGAAACPGGGGGGFGGSGENSNAAAEELNSISGGGGATGARTAGEAAIAASAAAAEAAGVVGPATDVVCPMYGRISELKAMAAAIEKAATADGGGSGSGSGGGGRRYPIVQCEYSHAMGNSNGGLDRYWELYRGPGPFQGGFIWDWVDQGLRALVWDGGGLAVGLRSLGAEVLERSGVPHGPAIGIVGGDGGSAYDGGNNIDVGKAAAAASASGSSRFQRWPGADISALYGGLPEATVATAAGGGGAIETWSYGGDFGERPTDNDFCCNGLMCPDRTPHPAIQELIYLQQPFRATFVAATARRRNRPRQAGSGAGSGRNGGYGGESEEWFAATVLLSVENRYEHIDDLAAHLTFGFVVSLDGRTAAAGTAAAVGTDGTDGRGVRLAATFTAPQLPAGPGHECFLTLTALLQDASPWAPAGHVVGWEQFALHPTVLPSAWSATAAAAAVVAAPPLWPLPPPSAGAVGTAGGGRSNLSPPTVSPQRRSSGERAATDGTAAAAAHWAAAAAGLPPPAVTEDAAAGTLTVVVAAGALRAIFGTATGHLLSLDVPGGGGSTAMPLMVPAAELEGEIADGAPCFPLTLQFHRAPTSNDRGGYLLQWQAAGVGAGELAGPRDAHLRWVRRGVDGAVVVTAAFVLEPRGDSKPLCRLMKRMRAYYEAAEQATADDAATTADGAATTADGAAAVPEPLVLRSLSRAEASFAHALAAAWRLGHTDVAAAGGEETAAVIVWYPARRLCSTHPLAEGMSLAPENASACFIEDGKEKEEAAERVGGGNGRGDGAAADDEESGEDFCAAACELVYTVLPTGAMTVTAHLSLPESWPPLPRVGLRLLLPESLGASLRWFGRGPHENCPDRKASATVGGYGGGVDAMETRYIRPGDSGSRTDVRWVAAVGDDGSGGADAVVAPWSEGAAVVNGGGASAAVPAAVGPAVLVTSNRPFTFSCSRSLPEDHMDRRHPEAVRRRPFVALNVDAAAMGVGGDDSWTASVHDDMLVLPGRFCFSFALMARGDFGRGGSAGADVAVTEWATVAYGYLLGVLAAANGTAEAAAGAKKAGP